MALEEAARRRRGRKVVNPVDHLRVIPAAPLQHLDTSSHKDSTGHTAILPITVRRLPPHLSTQLSPSS